MTRAYTAVLHGDFVEWIHDRPEITHPIPVRITVLEEADVAPPSSMGGEAMAQALTALATGGVFSAIADPVEWQREVRRERHLPDRGP